MSIRYLSGSLCCIKLCIIEGKTSFAENDRHKPTSWSGKGQYFRDYTPSDQFYDLTRQLKDENKPFMTKASEFIFGKKHRHGMPKDW